MESEDEKPPNDRTNSHVCIATSADFQLRFGGDPFVGILRRPCSSKDCCSRFSMFDELEKNQTSSLPRESLTLFGRKLCQFSKMRDFLLESFWKSFPSSVNELDEEDIFAMKNKISYTDDNGVFWGFDACSQCKSPFRFVRKPQCCKQAICQPCWQLQVRLAARLQGRYDLQCHGCSKLVPFCQALDCTDPDDMNLLRNPKHTYEAVWGACCPSCLESPSNDVASRLKTKKTSGKRGGIKVTCPRCDVSYCLLCGLEYGQHNIMTCQQLNNVLFEKWATSKSLDFPDFQNAQKCPSCHAWICLSGGCPNVQCERCDVWFHFCCGRRFGTWRSKNFHTPISKYNRYLPVVSCPALWKSQRQRRAVHSAVIAGSILLSPLIAAILPLAAVGWGISIFVMDVIRAERDYSD